MAAYNGIRFDYGGLARDIRCMRALASPLLENPRALDEFATQLENIRCAKTTAVQCLELPSTAPLRTVISEGEFRNSSRGGGRSVFGLLSCKWEIVNPEKARRQQRWFHLVGTASTSVCVYLEGGADLIARWQFEAGDAASPGCHFHCAVNQYGAEGPFPEWLKVPRFPGILFTPMDGLEFLLGELFQKRWRETVSKASYARDTWASSQSDRLDRTLRWQQSHVVNWETTPWMTLKAGKPPLDIMGP